jgi:anti-sigma-K factor RskA
MSRWRQHTGSHTLAPLLRERWEAIWRGTRFGRILMARRVAAAVLFGLAMVLALRQGSSGDDVVAVVVTTKDLAPGTVVGHCQLGHDHDLFLFCDPKM